MAYSVGQNVPLTFGDRLRLAREALCKSKGVRITQGDIAVSIGVQRNTVSRWENGGMLPKDPNIVAELARVLGVSSDWLIGGIVSGRDRDVSSSVDEEPGTYRVRLSATEDLPTAVADHIFRYLERLSIHGCSKSQIAEAEAFMVYAIQHTLTLKPFHKRELDEIHADVDFAWDFVVSVMRRSGIRV